MDNYFNWQIRISKSNRKAHQTSVFGLQFIWMFSMLFLDYSFFGCFLKIKCKTDFVPQINFFFEASSKPLEPASSALRIKT